ncbi:hypothetical protein Golax_009152, partial [Gossypium laxum]|nr:hypothetical protein [Gossypium laxum]
MAQLKAPGSEDFHVYFFQNQWDVVGDAVCKWVQNAAGINDFFRNVIMYAIMGSSMQVLGNGVQTQKFKSIKDDLVIFSHIDIEQAKRIKSILEQFWNFSGYRINKRKTNVFFSKGDKDELKDSIVEVLGFHRVTNLETYLGVSLFQAKLQRWDARQLSLAGRGSSNERKKMALVSWKSICQPHSCGGLGLKQMRDQNTSFMFKLGFKLASNSSTLWVRVLQSKYGMKEDMSDNIPRGRSWNLDMFQLRIPNESIKRIVSITPLYASTELDNIAWMAKLSNADGVVNVEYGSATLGGVLRDYGAVKAIQMFTKTSLDFALIRRIQQLLIE